MAKGTFTRGKPHVKLVEVNDGHQLKKALPRILKEADAFLASLLEGIKRKANRRGGSGALGRS